MKFLIDKNLMKKIEELTSTDYGLEEYYDDEKKVWINRDVIEPLLDDLIWEMEEREERFNDFKQDVKDNFERIPVERQLS
jgi:hypothetical protein